MAERQCAGAAAHGFAPVHTRGTVPGDRCRGAALVAVVSLQPTGGDRSHQWLAVADARDRCCDDGFLTSPHGRSQGIAETAELHERLCPDPETACNQSLLVGSPAGGTAQWRIAEQCFGFKAAVCIHRGTGQLGGSELDQHRNHPDLRPTRQSESAGGVSAASAAPGSCRPVALERDRQPSVRGHNASSWSVRDGLDLQPWGLAWNARGVGDVDAFADPALHTSLATHLAPPASPRRAVAGGSPAGRGRHQARTDPHPGCQPSGRSR